MLLSRDVRRLRKALDCSQVIVRDRRYEFVYPYHKCSLTFGRDTNKRLFFVSASSWRGLFDSCEVSVTMNPSVSKYLVESSTGVDFLRLLRDSRDSCTVALMLTMVNALKRCGVYVKDFYSDDGETMCRGVSFSDGSLKESESLRSLFGKVNVFAFDQEVRACLI